MTGDAQTTPRLGERSLGDIAHSLNGQGLGLDLGACAVRVRSDSSAFASQLKTVYGHFDCDSASAWADVHIDIRRATGLRRWIRPQVLLQCDGQQPFEPFPADSPLPLFEWGCNWQIAHRLNKLLLFHAGALERDGLTLILPAMPGSGKSTLTAALSQRGWRLLSDEFGAYEPSTDSFRAILKPVALKNQSIEAIRAFAPEAVLGPEFPKTRKGRVAHLAATRESVARRHEVARPGAVVLPQWEAGSKTRWEPLQEHATFRALAFNAFNYTVLGELGFRAAVHLARTCPAWQLVYSDLEDAVAVIKDMWPNVVAQRTGSGS